MSCHFFGGGGGGHTNTFRDLDVPETTKGCTQCWGVPRNGLGWSKSAVHEGYIMQKFFYTSTFQDIRYEYKIYNYLSII